MNGGAKFVEQPLRPSGMPVNQSLTRNISAKQATGKAAARLCEAGEGVMIDGGTTTLQMCPHFAGLNLQVLTNSLHIVDALLPQTGTRILLPSGSVFREQNLVLAPAGEDSMPQFHSPKLFMDAAAVGPQGIMQAGIILIAAERRFIDRAEKIVLLVDSTKLQASSGGIVCGLGEIDVLITGRGISASDATMLEEAGIRLIIAD